MTGSTICVYGKVLYYSAGPVTTDIYFGNKTSDFHFISTIKEFPDVQQGQCVKSSGIVTSSYGSLVIDIPHLYQITPDSTCDKYP